MSINRNEIAAQRSRHYPTIDLVVEYDYLDITQGGSHSVQLLEKIQQFH